MQFIDFPGFAVSKKQSRKICPASNSIMIRKLIAIFNRSVSERRAAPRYKFEVPVKYGLNRRAEREN
jgi:hypothetical protein